MLAAQPLFSFHANSCSNSPACTAGTPESPIVVCGPREAVVTGAGNYANKPYGFLVRNSTHVTLAGFTITRGFKGVCAGLENEGEEEEKASPSKLGSALSGPVAFTGPGPPLAPLPCGRLVGIRTGTQAAGVGEPAREGRLATLGGEPRHFAVATLGCASTGGWFSSSELTHTHPHPILLILVCIARPPPPLPAPLLPNIFSCCHQTAQPAAPSAAGLMVEGCQNCVFDGLRVYDIGYEGVRLRYDTIDSVIRVRRGGCMSDG